MSETYTQMRLSHKKVPVCTSQCHREDIPELSLEAIEAAMKKVEAIHGKQIEIAFTCGYWPLKPIVITGDI